MYDATACMHASIFTNTRMYEIQWGVYREKIIKLTNPKKQKRARDRKCNEAVKSNDINKRVQSSRREGREKMLFLLFGSGFGFLLFRFVLLLFVCTVVVRCC